MELILKNKLVTGLIAVLLLTNAGSLVTLWILHFRTEKQPRLMVLESEHAPPGDMITTVLADRFHFTGTQLETAGDLRDTHFRQTKTIRDSILALKNQLNLVLFTEKPNRETVRAFTREIGEQQARLESLNFDHFHRLWLLADQDQRPAFESFIRSINERMAPKARTEKRMIIHQRVDAGKDEVKEMIWVDGEPGPEEVAPPAP